MKSDRRLLFEAAIGIALGLWVIYLLVNIDLPDEAYIYLMLG